MDCHKGRLIPDPIVRDMLRALGIVTCSKCHRFIRQVGRSRWRERSTD